MRVTSSFDHHGGGDCKHTHTSELFSLIIRQLTRRGGASAPPLPCPAAPRSRTAACAPPSRPPRRLRRPRAACLFQKCGWLFFSLVGSGSFGFEGWTAPSELPPCLSHPCLSFSTCLASHPQLVEEPAGLASRHDAPERRARPAALVPPTLPTPPALPLLQPRGRYARGAQHEGAARRREEPVHHGDAAAGGAGVVVVVVVCRLSSLFAHVAVARAAAAAFVCRR